MSIIGLRSSLPTMDAHWAERLTDTELAGWIDDYDRDRTMLAGITAHMVAAAAGRGGVDSRILYESVPVAREFMRVHDSGQVLFDEYHIRVTTAKVLATREYRELVGDNT